MNQKLSTQAKKKTPAYMTTVRMTEEAKLFQLALTLFDGVNFSKFTRELWKSTPEWIEFQETLRDPEKIEFLRKHLPKQQNG